MGSGQGGVTGTQKNLAAGQLSQTATDASRDSADQSAIANNQGTQLSSFYGNRMNNGLPFYRSLTDYGGGNIAQAFAPVRGDIMRRTSQYGTNMPSGYRDALLTNLGAQQGRAFDSTLTDAMMANEQAKQFGASGISGQQQLAANRALAYKNLGANADQSIISAQQKPSTWGTIAGGVQQGLKAATMLA
jgi:hypothetical protein